MNFVNISHKEKVITTITNCASIIEASNYSVLDESILMLMTDDELRDLVKKHSDYQFYRNCDSTERGRI